MGNDGQVVLVGKYYLSGNGGQQGGNWGQVATRGSCPQPALPLFPVHHSRGQPRCQVFSARQCQGQVVVAVSDVDATS